MSFLISVKKSGEITEIKWSDPIYLISTVQINLTDLVIERDRKILLDEINMSTTLTSYSSKEYTFIDYEKGISLCFICIEDRIFVFGYEDIPPSVVAYHKIIERFMNTFKDTYLRPHELINNSVRFQFEHIQTLNSELIDTKRLLEKTNIQINKLNKELNNRLVKDELTGLISKYQYRNEMEYLIKQNQDKNGIFIFIDIDDFKSVNDTFGHRSGDDYLVEFAKRLQEIPIANVIAIRIAGDEFGLFVYGLETFNEYLLQDIWDKLQQALLKPIVINNTQLNFSVSAGMSIFGKDTTEIYDLIEYADYAMYLAKKSGKNHFSVFNKSMYLNSKLKG